MSINHLTRETARVGMLVHHYGVENCKWKITKIDGDNISLRVVETTHPYWKEDAIGRTTISRIYLASELNNNEDALILLERD